MIFSVALDAALVGRKKQTMRPVREGDKGDWINKSGTAVRRNGRLMWEVGRLYAIVPRRGASAVGHFRCTYLKLVRNPLKISPRLAVAEGFASRKDFLAAWAQLYPRKQSFPCWAIGMELVKR